MQLIENSVLGYNQESVPGTPLPNADPDDPVPTIPNPHHDPLYRTVIRAVATLDIAL